ncbi:MAG: Nif3-like dinuclear metal center hexameric protein [Bacilli bacterium]|nr:Nif3-like dinuclear metal center hexameric protein [Bacilli bacterium]
MKTKVLLAKLAKRFPKKYAKMNHDFVGLMAGKLPEEVHKILLCLDFDEEVFPLALEYKPDLILTHHPFIFGPKSKVLKSDTVKAALYEKVLDNNLVIYSMHTNFDTGKGGMNDALSEALGLKDVYAPEDEIMMRIGYLEKEMEVEEFARYAKKRLNVDYGLLIAKGNKMIKKVGIIGGGGSRDFIVARNEGADIYISGDVPHHVRRGVVTLGYNYLDLPHEIEKIFMPQMKKLLLEMDDTLDIYIVDHEELPKVI